MILNRVEGKPAVYNSATQQANLSSTLNRHAYRDLLTGIFIPVNKSLKQIDNSCQHRVAVKWVVVALILLDATQTYIAVGYLGAHENVLFFVNQNPLAIWLVAAVKVVATLYVDKMRRIYAWAGYILPAAVFSHLFAVANNTYWLILYLLHLF
jgi:hypothetical protein